MVNKFDYVIINTVLESACEDVAAILRAEKLQSQDNKGVGTFAH